MQDIIKYGLDRSPYNESIGHIDGWQNIINSFIMSSYFPWVCLILIINGRNWKKPINLILIGNWFFRAIGDILKATMDLRPHEPNTFWPFSHKNWYIGFVLAHVFWFLGEIIGDWYPLLRTKIVTNDKKKMMWVYITCIFYNFVKVLAMFCGLINFPIDLKITDEKAVTTEDLIQYNIAWWSTIALMQLASCLYDLSIINALNSFLSDTIKNFKVKGSYTFLEKFKQISEFRIIFSMLASIVFFPIVTVFVVFLILDYNDVNSRYHQKSDAEIEQMRIAVLNFNYALMYMDQVLLRYFIERSSEKTIISSKEFTYSGLHLNNSKENINNYGKKHNSLEEIIPQQNTIDNSGTNYYQQNNINYNIYSIKNLSFSNSRSSLYNDIARNSLYNDISRNSFYNDKTIIHHPNMFHEINNSNNNQNNYYFEISNKYENINDHPIKSTYYLDNLRCSIEKNSTINIK